MIAAHSDKDDLSNTIEYHGETNHFNYEILLENDQTPKKPECSDGEVYIDG